VHNFNPALRELGKNFGRHFKWHRQGRQAAFKDIFALANAGLMIMMVQSGQFKDCPLAVPYH
jgi:hypothetical protein